MTYRLPFIAPALTAVMLASCPLAASAAADAIVIGQVVDLSGQNAEIGRDYVAGIKTYFDALNAAGGINGKRVHYLTRDDEGKPEVATRLTSDLIDREHVDYLFGGVGDATTQAVLTTPAFVRSGMLLFAPLTYTVQKTGSPVMVWRPNYQQEIRHLFAHFVRLGYKDVGVVYQETPSNRDAYAALSSEIRQRQMKLIGTVRIGHNNDEIVDQANALAAASPGFVMIVADTISTALFLKEFRKKKPQTFVAGTSLLNLSTLREVAGAKAVEWTVFSQVVPNPHAATSVLQAEHINMMRKYRDEPLSALTLEGFAAAKALAQAIRRAKSSHRNALQEIAAGATDIDLGGLSITVTSTNQNLSNYLDVALFRKGSGLLF